MEKKELEEKLIEKNSNQLNKLVKFEGGSSQFRIQENHEMGKTYFLYDQNDLLDDLCGCISQNNEKREISTLDRVKTLQEGDVIFSLISGIAAIIQKEHEGYVFTQNYIKIIPKEKIDKYFLVYSLNESKAIRKQFFENLQGSFVLKYTGRQLRNIKMPKFPTLKEQEAIGKIYFKQKKLEMLKKTVATLETKLIFEKIRGRGTR